MALSMDEQRILAEIERQLADDDPSLAARLTTFGRPGLMASLRTPRGRVLASFLVVAVVAVLSLMVYALIPLRVPPARSRLAQAEPRGRAAGPGAASRARPRSPRCVRPRARTAAGTAQARPA